MSAVLTVPHIDASEKKLVWERVQDVEPILERNKALRSMEQKSDWGRHVATIPNVVLEQWLNEEYAKGNVNIRLFSDEFNKIVERKLKDHDWLFLRTDK